MAHKTIADLVAYQQSLKNRRKDRLALTAEEFRKTFRYDPETGAFWRRCGLEHKGYLYISVNGISYAAHRLAWLYMMGHWPALMVDHKNGDTTDNRFENLREATRIQNWWNRRKRTDNTTGYKGVSFHKKNKKFIAIAQRKLDGKTTRVFLGSFDTAEEAHEAYKAAAVKLHGEFARFD